ncbi:MAG: GNAT family N-acetyltransferase [Chitinophagaceae bacterium]|nr:GNAT family N-acetyltransferase [Chitinophagaceae bacterium]
MKIDKRRMINWIFEPFDKLTNLQVYAMLQLRSRVFVVEQACVFLDPDGLDQGSHHLLGYQGSTLAACARILPPGLAYPGYASIGRVVTAPEVRGGGAGRTLMQQAIGKLYQLHGQVPIKIGAQQYLERFYQSLGFVQSGPMYIEDGIPHIPMVISIGAEG